MGELIGPIMTFFLFTVSWMALPYFVLTFFIYVPVMFCNPYWHNNKSIQHVWQISSSKPAPEISTPIWVERTKVLKKDNNRSGT